MANEYHYPGSELALFEKAVNWKNYLACKIMPHLGGSVLEVGAGIGATTRVFNNGTAPLWTLLEPDPQMCRYLAQQKHTFPRNVKISCGTIQDLENQQFDAILYIDVLEHIENDRQEITAASKRLKENGRLIILSPAFNSLFSDFDKSIGHFRRYNKSRLKEAIPGNLKMHSLQYLDTAGFFASAMNRLFLHQSYPTEKQVLFWDRYLVPLSKIADRAFIHSFGKSILGIWEK